MKMIGRLLFMAIFVRGAWDLVQEPTPRAEQARRLGLPISDAFARACGCAMIAAGLALPVSTLTRPAATLLALELPIFTLIGHRFWEHAGPQRVQHRLHFFKNVSLAGAAVYMAADRID